jgi:hypothetical protein
MAEKRTQMSFTFSGETIAIIEDLKTKFGVETNTAVVKRALALALICANSQRDDHTVTIVGKGENRRDIIVNA